MASQGKVRVDAEFESLIPAMTAEELEGLERQLETEGCRDAFVVWGNHGNTLLDGHHRYKLCVKHGLPYPVPHKLEFESRDDAKNWVIDNQLSRRNISAYQRVYLIGKRYKAVRPPTDPPQVADKVSATTESTNTPPPVDGQSTAATIADQHGVSERSVRRAGEFAEALDAAAEKAPELKPVILAGKHATTKQLQTIAALPEKDAQAVASAVKFGKPVKAALESVTGNGKPPKKQTAPKAAKATKPKAGKPTFDDRKIDQTFGKLVRLVDDRAAAYGGQDNHHGACMTDLNEFKADFNAWQKAGRGAK